MPTPMWVYAEIARRYGIEEETDEAVDTFFAVTVPTLTEGAQAEILEELLLRDGEQEKRRLRVPTARLLDDNAPWGKQVGRTLNLRLAKVVARTKSRKLSIFLRQAGLSASAKSRTLMVQRRYSLISKNTAESTASLKRDPITAASNDGAKKRTSS
jgi:hypothetical protein